MNYSYIYPVSNGSIEVVVSEEHAINVSKTSASKAYEKASSNVKAILDAKTDKEYLNDFITVHWAIESRKKPGTYIESYTGSPVPVGATHLGPYGYIKEKGKFYYIYKDSGWLALSGKPVGAIYKL